jgi:hypothetical protein
MAGYHLAQVNIGAIKGPMDSPLMADFAANLARVNALAEETIDPASRKPLRSSKCCDPKARRRKLSRFAGRSRRRMLFRRVPRSPSAANARLSEPSAGTRSLPPR